MTYDELLKSFGEKLGGVELVPDDSGMVVLDVDEMQLAIIGLEEVGQVVLSGAVAEPPPEDKMERLYRAILEANYNFTGTFGATLSINPEDGQVTLCRSLALAILDGDAFFAAAENFINTLETWRKLVSDYRAAADEPEKAQVPPVDTFGGMGGFMQV